MVCDFCTDPNVQWRFETEPFGLDYGGVILGQSDEGWAACDLCAAHILKRDHRGLAERALAVNPINVPGEMEMQLWAQGLFFQHWRRTPPTRIETQS